MGDKVQEKVGNNLGPIPLLVNATSGSETTQLKGTTRDWSIYVEWSSGVSGGEVIVETAKDESYTGTWALLATLSAASDKQDIVQGHGPFRAIRTRISIAITGGNVSTELQGY